MRRLLIKPQEPEASRNDKSIIIIGGRQFTIYDTYYIEEKINITDGYMWFIQYDNYNEISLKNFQRFMSKSSIGSFNFKETLEYLGITFSSIPQGGFEKNVLKDRKSTQNCFLVYLMIATKPNTVLVCRSWR